MKPNNIAHFFDLDGTLWNVNCNVWVIDKENPTEPIIKIGQYEIKKILDDFYKRDDIMIEYDEEVYYISKSLFNKIQKKRKLPIERLGLSWIEYLDPEDIPDNNITYLTYNYKHVKDQQINILTGRNNRKKHAQILNRLRLKLKEYNIDIFKIYFVSNIFYKQHEDVISYNKSKILLEHLVGVKIEDDKFIALKQDWFANVHFYDDEKKTIDIVNDMNDLLYNILKNTDDDVVYKIVVERVQKYELLIHTHLVSNNITNLFKNSFVKLVLPSYNL
jgi:hypothetical protein